VSSVIPSSPRGATEGLIQAEPEEDPSGGFRFELVFGSWCNSVQIRNNEREGFTYTPLSIVSKHVALGAIFVQN